MWMIFSLFGALFQAIEMAIKKKALQTRGMNNFIAFLAFIFAGIILFLLFFSQTGMIWHDTTLSLSFWNGMFWYVALNVLAVYFLYKALDIAELNYLMPFFALTSFSLIIPAIFVFGEIPTIAALFGISLIVIGAIVMDYGNKASVDTEKEKAKQNRKGKIYFLVTALCFTFAPTAQKVAVVESSALFVSYLVHLLIGLSFLGLIFISREQSRIRETFRMLTRPGRLKFLGIILLAGISIGIANTSINIALGAADVAVVMGIKRLMPLFAFVIGFLYFRERTGISKKITATSLMVLGAVLITLFGV
jgi:drug/metabolite transporter (DMT)-like permease